jgi:hypothetical protein
MFKTPAERNAVIQSIVNETLVIMEKKKISYKEAEDIPAALEFAIKASQENRLMMEDFRVISEEQLSEYNKVTANKIGD